jgi:hypothetical protein
MRGNLKLHVIHVAGTRMQEEGADGASSGELLIDVMNRTHILQYIPLHQSALKVAPKLEEWIQGCWPKERGELNCLTSDDWYSYGVPSQNCIWAPAQAVVAPEQLACMIHKHPSSFLCLLYHGC